MRPFQPCGSRRDPERGRLPSWATCNTCWTPWGRQSDTRFSASSGEELPAGAIAADGLRYALDRSSVNSPSRYMVALVAWNPFDTMMALADLGGHMSMDWTFLRDKVVIDQAFRAELLAEIRFRGLPLGSRLLVAARDVIHAPNYVLRLEGYHLSIFADRYDAAGGGIDLSGSDGAPGSRGSQGAEGYASAGGANNKPGGAGGRGGNGLKGANGTTLTIAAATIGSARLSSRGGSGGAGGQGGAGGRGGGGSRGNPPHYEGWEGTSGGRGGDGGTGALAGAGGAITLFSIEPMSLAVEMSAPGGAGGAPGAGGAGGMRGAYSIDASDGRPGTRGATGRPGPDAAMSKTQLDEAHFWEWIRRETVAAAKWADYRRRVGEYYFRAFNGSDPERVSYLQLAEHEFTCALRLNPTDLRAGLMLRQIQSNENILGLARDFDLVPDFDRYERVTTDYAPMILGMFDTAREILELAYDVDGNKTRVANQIPRLQASLEILSIERSAAALDTGVAKTNVASIDAQMGDLGRELELNRQELEKWLVELGGRQVQSVFKICIAVVAVIGAAYSGGASLAAVPGLMVGAQDAWKEIKYDPVTKSMKYQGQGVETWFTWEKGVPKLKPEVQKLAKGLEDVVKKSIDIIDKVRLLREIDTSTVHGDLRGKGRALMRRSAQLSMDRALAVMRLEQTNLFGEAIDLRGKQAARDLETARAQEAAMQSDVRFLGGTARLIVSATQGYLDVITKYIFLAARSLEIFTFADHRYPVTFDYGHIHPDIEESAYLALSRGDSSRVLALLRSYASSATAIPSVILYRDRYETYRMGLSGDLQYWIYDAPEAIETFKKTHSIEFTIGLDELLPGRFEAKVEHVFFSLIGATAADPRITCMVDHSGLAYAKRENGELVTIVAPPRRTSVAAGTRRDELGGEIVPSHLPLFWGRSPATTWGLSIEPEVMSMSTVDLSQLSAVQVAIAYQSL